MVSKTLSEAGTMDRNIDKVKQYEAVLFFEVSLSDQPWKQREEHVSLPI